MENRIKIVYIDDKETPLESFSRNIPMVWSTKFNETVSIETFHDLVEKKNNRWEIEIRDIGTYDLVLLDVFWENDQNFHEPHGVDIAEEIRQVYPELPIVILTQFSSVLDDAKLFERLSLLHVSSYISKKSDIGTLVFILRDIISKKFEDRTGQVLYKKLREMNKVGASWNIDTINEAATSIWRQNNYHGKWIEFWEIITNKVLGDKGIYNPFSTLLEFFKNNDLINLGVLPSMRGHLQHVLYVYFTGYIISHEVTSFKNTVNKSIKKLLDDYDASKSEYYWDLFQFAWLTCATLHDTAYSLELIPNFQAKLKEVASIYKFAEIDGMPLDFAKLSINWNDPGANYANEESFVEILNKLHKNTFPSSWIKDNSIFREKDFYKFNHGVCSAISFLNILKDYEDNLKSKGDLLIFLKWAATAMALHSLKHCGKKEGKGIHYEKDPLSFLLMLSDELQVWNRERPDINVYESEFQLVDLEKLEIIGDSISCEIKYIPFSKTTKKEIIEYSNNLLKKIEQDGLILHKYLIPNPLKITIKFSVQGNNIKHREILLV